MGDLIDSIFQRQCSLTDSKDRRGRSGQRDTTDVTILEVGAQKTVDTYHCRSFSDLRDYLDRKDEHDEEESYWDEPINTRPSYLRLFFLPPLEDGHTNTAAPTARQLPGFTEMLHEKVGLSPVFMDDYSEADEEDSVSPTSSPRRSAVATRSRRSRFALDGLEKDALMSLQPQKEEEEPSQTWVWETRYTQSTTQTLSDPDTTTYFCVNYPQRLQRRILDTIQGLEALAKNPLFLDTLIIDEMIAYYRDAIKVHRAQLLALQNDNSTNNGNGNGNGDGHDDDDDDEFGPGGGGSSRATELTIRLEELAGNWRTILRDIQSIQAHIRHLRSLAEARKSRPRRSRTPPPPSPSPHPFPRGDFLPRGHSHRGHTRQQSSDVFGPPASEILQLQSSTCEFWTRCVTMYLDKTCGRIDRASASSSAAAANNSTSTYTLRKTIPLLRRRGSMPQINRRLSNFTVEVAVQIQRNSSSVSTLALSLFTTIFFSPDGLLFAITYWWWILATLVVPLTFIVLHLGVETLASNTAFVRRRKEAARRLGGVAEGDDDDEEQQQQRAEGGGVGSARARSAGGS